MTFNYEKSFDLSSNPELELNNSNKISTPNVEMVNNKSFRDSNIRADMSWKKGSTQKSLSQEQIQEEFSKSFAVGTVFDNLESMRSAAISYGEKYNCPMTTGKSMLKEQRLTMICIHGQAYRSAKKQKLEEDYQIDKKKKNMTFRLNCPFSVYGRFNAKQKKFVVKTVVSEHNHHLANDPRTYSTNRKLNPSHFEFAVQLLKTNTPAKTLEVYILSF